MPSKKDIDIKKYIRRKMAKTIVVLTVIFMDFLITVSMFLAVWVLDLLARILGMESFYVIQILNNVSEIGLIITFLVVAASGVYSICNLYKE